jgi:hypothetical protein
MWVLLLSFLLAKLTQLYLKMKEKEAHEFMIWAGNSWKI